MYNSQIVNSLKKLSTKELSEYEDIVNSPFFNKDNKVRQLFDYLKSHWPTFDAPRLHRSVVLAELFSGKKTSYLSTTMSKLTKLMEEYWTQRALNENPFQKKLLLLQRQLKNNDLDTFVATFKKINKLRDQIIKKDTNYYLESYLLENCYLEYSDLSVKSAKPRVSEVIHSLDLFYLSKKLNLSCELLNLQQFLDIDYKSVMMKDISHLINQEEYLKHDLLQIYHAILNMLTFPDKESYFEHFMQLLATNLQKKLKKKELYEVSTHAVNYCIRQIIAGNEKYRVRLFETYLLVIDWGLIFKGEYIDLPQMKNMISVACQLGKIDWAIQFNEQHKDNIHPKNRESSYHFHLATIYFYNKQYKEALGNLILVQEADFLRVLDSKILLLKCYYELLESEACYNLGKSILSLLNSTKKLNKNRKKAYNSFTRLALRLFRYKEGFSKEKLSRIANDVNSAELISDKKWLQEKLSENDR